MGKSRKNYGDDYGGRIRHNEKDVNKNKHRKNLYKYSVGYEDDDQDDYDTNRKY
jgi:hypothetical protein